MTEKITFHLVSPEKSLASLDVKSISVPGIEGDMTLLPNHADFLTTLRPGIIQVETDNGPQEFLVTLQTHSASFHHHLCHGLLHGL